MILLLFQFLIPLMFLFLLLLRSCSWLCCWWNEPCSSSLLPRLTLLVWLVLSLVLFLFLFLLFFLHLFLLQICSCYFYWSCSCFCSCTCFCYCSCHCSWFLLLNLSYHKPECLLSSSSCTCSCSSSAPDTFISPVLGPASAFVSVPVPAFAPSLVNVIPETRRSSESMLTCGCWSRPWSLHPLVQLYQNWKIQGFLGIVHFKFFNTHAQSWDCPLKLTIRPEHESTRFLVLNTHRVWPCTMFHSMLYAQAAPT